MGLYKINRLKQLVFLLSAVLCTQIVNAQKYSTKSGKLSFEASVPLFEDVNATDNKNVTVLDSSNGSIASVSSVSNFKFTVKLMEEHFNESYAETAKYPKTSFKGKILNFKLSELSANAKNYTIQGTLNFHGVDKEIKSTATISLSDGKIHIKGKFKAKPADFKVKIPKMMTKKIAEEVEVAYQFTLSKQ